MKTLSILGSTGSIGRQTLDIVREFPHQFAIAGLTAGNNIDLFKQQILEFKPKRIGVLTEAAQQTLRAFVADNALHCEVLVGPQGLIDIAAAPDNDLLVVAIVGTASLMPTYRAIEAGIPIGLACKEVLVAAGDRIMALAKTKNVPILPIDSEHAALKQCLAGIQEDPNQVDTLILTASGGPFWNRPATKFSTITREEALRHPKWTMGSKITIDSSTLMNKGLEIIEAHQLFGIGYDSIQAVIHPQSIVHALVEFTDGTHLAQLGLPDMRFPIQYALTYPEKWPNPWPKKPLWELGELTFFEPDVSKFPLLQLAFDCGKAGGSLPAVMNAANEAAVHLFLEGKIGYTDIHRCVAKAVETHIALPEPDIETLVALDAETKEKTLLAHA
ncbi:MAG: 1-deoxy-D-xylulose-5-phosphate reductoisomerase [Candidatus Margulisiibacteriota bacterium]